MRCSNEKHPACLHAWHLASMIHANAMVVPGRAGCRRSGGSVADAPTGLASARQHDSCASSAPLWHDSGSVRWHICRLRTVRIIATRTQAYLSRRISGTVRGPPLLPEEHGIHAVCTCLAYWHPFVHSSIQIPISRSSPPELNGIEWPVGCYRPKLSDTRQEKVSNVIRTGPISVKPFISIQGVKF